MKFLKISELRPGATYSKKMVPDHQAFTLNQSLFTWSKEHFTSDFNNTGLYVQHKKQNPTLNALYSNIIIILYRKPKSLPPIQNLIALKNLQAKK
jgi:hypothetical protein